MSDKEIQSLDFKRWESKKISINAPKDSNNEIGKIEWELNMINFELKRFHRDVEFENYFLEWCTKNNYDIKKIKILFGLFHINSIVFLLSIFTLKVNAETKIIAMSGDTLFKLSNRYGVSLKELMH